LRFEIALSALVSLSLLSPSAMGERVAIRVLKGDGANFAAPEASPVVSWTNHKAGTPEEAGSQFGSSTTAERVVDLLPGVWYFGASQMVGFSPTLKLGAAAPQDVSRGPAVITISKGAKVDILVSYQSKGNNSFKANEQITCASESAPLFSAEKIEGTGSTVGFRANLDKKYGGMAASLELFSSVTPSSGLQVLTPVAGVSGGWQSRVSLSTAEIPALVTFAQGGGENGNRWGYAASINGLLQTDFTALGEGRSQTDTFAKPSFGNACFASSRRLLDGQMRQQVDALTLPKGGKVMKVRSTYTYRLRQEMALTSWIPEQSLGLDRFAALEGDLAIYLTGVGRKWESPALRPQIGGFTGIEASCHQKLDKAVPSLRGFTNNCQAGEVAYAIFVWKVGKAEVAMAVAADGGAPFSAEIIENKTALCSRTGVASLGATPQVDPDCGQIEWRALIARGPESMGTLPSGKSLEYSMNYLIGSPLELAQLGFTYSGGPRHSGSLDLAMVKVGSASISLTGVESNPASGIGKPNTAIPAGGMDLQDEPLPDIFQR
jgi:hypothetical protein